MQFSTLILFIAAVLATPTQVAFYKDHKVVQVAKTPQVHQLLEKINADIWSEVGDTVKVRVSPSQFTKLKSQLPKDSKLNVLIEDVQETIKDVQQPIDEEEGESSLQAADWFSDYHTYEAIKTWYTQHAQSNPGVVKFVPSIGKSFQNNDIFAVHLTNPNDTPKKKIWFQSLIHAREWITGTTTQYIFNHLLTNRQSDPAIKKILDEVEIIFIPIVNPDGYIYTRTERYWRKNRHAVAGGDGVDLNRNFPFRWGRPGASTDPNNITYRGPSAASEPETQAINSYFTAQGPIAGAIDWHSYSELVLRPYGDTRADAPHEAKLKELGDGIKDKIKAVRGKVYTSQKSNQLYPTSGTASDWFYGFGNAYGYTIELSPNGNFFDAADPNKGFAPPASEIVPVGKDLLPAAIHFIKFVTANPLDKTIT